MKKKVYTVFSAVLALCISISFSGCGKSSASAFPEKTSSDAQNKNIKETGIVAENKDYTLIWDNDNKAVFLTDKQTGNCWGTMPFNPAQMSEEMNTHVLTRASLILNYIEPNALGVKSETSTVGAVRNGYVSAYKVNSGVKVEYHFKDLGICIPVSYSLLEDGIKVSCVPSEIIEGKNKVYSVALSPMMAAAQNDSEDSWLFVPSGSGALINVNTVLNEKTYCEEVYGTDPSHNIRVTRTNTDGIRLPVFGVKQGNKALLGVISNGAETASVKAQAGNQRVKYSSVYADFAIRGTEIAEDTTGGTAQNISIFSETKNNAKCLSVSYFPLSGECADYVGMANRYREYLSENGYEFEAKKQNPLYLNILGGVQLREFFLGIPYRSTKALTTLKQAERIIDCVKNQAGVSPVVKLIGFGTGGLNADKPAGGLTVCKSMGTEKQLKDLELLCVNKDVPLFFDFDLLYFSKSGNGISKYFNTAKAPNKQAVALYPTQIALRNPDDSFKQSYLTAHKELLNLADSAVDKATDLNIGGISFNTLSNTAYSDYATDSGAVKGGTENRYRKVMKLLNGKKISIAASKANVYAIKDSDYLFDVPLESSKYDAFFAEIPFYEIVFRGYVPMGCEAVNMSFDPHKKMLLAAEAGCGLTYSLTGSFEKEFLDSTQTLVGTLYYEDVLETAGEQIKRIKELLDCIDGAPIVSHNIDGEIRIVGYDNGVKVAVNYSHQVQDTQYGEIPAEDFIIICGEDKQ